VGVVDAPGVADGVGVAVASGVAEAVLLGVAVTDGPTVGVTERVGVRKGEVGLGERVMVGEAAGVPGGIAWSSARRLATV
jgi:hypothetical protein